MNATQHLDTVLAAWFERVRPVLQGDLHALSEEAGQDRMMSEFFDTERSTANSISACEALLCLFLPQSELDEYSLGSIQHQGTVSDKRENIVRLINGLGTKLESTSGNLDPDGVSRLLALADCFLTRFHDEEEDKAIFTAGSYLEPIPEPDRPLGHVDPDAIDIVDSYTLSVSLCLILLFLIRQWRDHWGDASKYDILARSVEAKAQKRLTAALVGLCDSFCVNIYGTDTWNTMTGVPWDAELEAQIVAVRKRAVRVTGRRLNPDEPFECGWSWSRISDPAPLPSGIKREDFLRPQSVHAEPAPYFYFSLAAVDGLADLLSERVQTEELLDATQLALAARLQLQWDVTSKYWSTIARCRRKLHGVKTDGWAIEYPPWHSSDGNASDYWTVALVGILLREIDRGGWSASDPALERLASLLIELAQRTRLNREETELSTPDPKTGRRIVTNEPTPGHFHITGKRSLLVIDGGEKGDVGAFTWKMTDLAAQVLKRSAQLARIVRDHNVRNRLDRLMDDIWKFHLSIRAFPAKRGYFWDKASSLPFTTLAGDTQEEGLSWYMTERVVDALVAADDAEVYPDRPSDLITQLVESIRWNALGLGSSVSASPEDRPNLDRARTLTREGKVVEGLALAWQVLAEMGKRSEGVRALPHHSN